MNTRPESELETVIGRELQNLPGCKAPASLVPQVMSIIQAQSQAAWWQKPVWLWPFPARTVLCGTLAVCAGLIMVLAWTYGSPLIGSLLPAQVNQELAVLSQARTVLAALANGADVIMRNGLQPLVIGALAVTSALYFLCLSSGSLFIRLAVKRVNVSL